jgi:cellobiose-specific phosphotransferase system component IIB
LKFNQCILHKNLEGKNIRNSNSFTNQIDYDNDGFIDGVNIMNDLYDYIPEAKILIIPDYIRFLRENDTDDYTYLVLPVEQINSYAYTGIEMEGTLILPNSLKKIKDFAFENT